MVPVQKNYEGVEHAIETKTRKNKGEERRGRGEGVARR